jgi:5-methylthioadenosine/S-adenosylhomocysteine deaminase
MTGEHQTPLYNVYSHLVYATMASDVDTVLINGRVVMKGGVVRTIDESVVRARANRYRSRILKSVAQ